MTEPQEMTVGDLIEIARAMTAVHDALGLRNDHADENRHAVERALRATLADELGANDIAKHTRIDELGRALLRLRIARNLFESKLAVIGRGKR